jgi:hypothetical protein
LKTEKEKITAQGPLGYKDTTDVFMEDDLLLTVGGVVKRAIRLQEGDVLVRFGSQPAVLQLWTIMDMEWVRREHK